MENFNLENVENVTYDGKEVHEVKLDGTSIWKFTPKEVTGFRVGRIWNRKEDPPRWYNKASRGNTNEIQYKEKFHPASHVELRFEWDESNGPSLLPSNRGVVIEFSNNHQFKNTGKNRFQPNMDNMSIIYDVPYVGDTRYRFTIPSDSPIITNSGYKNSLQKDGFLQSHTYSHYYARIAINHKVHPEYKDLPYDWSDALNLKTPFTANDINLCARVKYNHPTGNAISVRWKIMNGQKIQNKFHLYRASGDSGGPQTGTGGAFRLEDWEELPFNDNGYGNNGEYIDTNVEDGKYYYYYIVDIQNKGKPNELRGDPSYVARAKCRSYGPMELTFANTNKVSLPIDTTYDSGFLKIDWGDGTLKEFDLSKYQNGRVANNGFNSSHLNVKLRKHEYDALSHTYSTTKNYTVKIYGELLETNFNNYHGDVTTARKAYEESNTKLTGCALGDTAPQSIESLCEGSEVRGLSWGISSANPQIYLPESILSLRSLFRNCQNTVTRMLYGNGQMDTSNVRNFSYMYSGTKLTEFNLNIDKASDLSSMFSHLVTDNQDTFIFHSTWPVLHFNSSGGYGSAFGGLVLNHMFTWCKGVRRIKFKDKLIGVRYGESAGKGNSIMTAWMFASCPELIEIGWYGIPDGDIENWNVTHFDKNQIYEMFGGQTTKLSDLNLSKWCLPGPKSVSFGPFGTGPWYDNVNNHPKWNCS